jgi:hypothetical protein
MSISGGGTAEINYNTNVNNSTAGPYLTFDKN